MARTKLRPPRHALAAQLRAFAVTKDDLLSLADKISLPIVCDEEKTSKCSMSISVAFTLYCSKEKQKNAKHTLGERKIWLQALQKWACDGQALLGGDDNSSWRASADTLRLEVPQFFVTAEDARFLNRLENDLYQAGGWRDLPVTDAIESFEPLLRVVACLTERAIRNLGEPKIRSANLSNRDLFVQLSGAFQTLHGRKLTVTNSKGAAARALGRDHLPGGVGIAWCRALIDLAVIRSEAIPETHAVLCALSRGANSPDALAKWIRAANGALQPMNERRAKSSPETGTK